MIQILVPCNFLENSDSPPHAAGSKGSRRNCNIRVMIQIAAPTWVFVSLLRRSYKMLIETRFKEPRVKMKTVSLVASLTFVIVLSGVNSVSASPQNNTVLEQAQKALEENQRKVPVGSYDSKGFQITNMSMVNKGYGSYEIIGFMKNIGNENYDIVVPVASLYDKKNNLIGVEEGYAIAGSDVAVPGGTSLFKILLSGDPSKVDHYVVEVTVTDPLY